MELSNADSLRYFAPELLLSGGAVCVFLLDLVLARRAFRVPVLIALGVFFALAAAACVFFVAAMPSGGGTVWSQPVGIFASDGLQGLVAVDRWALSFKVLLFAATALGILMVAPGSDLPVERTGDYIALLLALAVGLALMVGANDLLIVSMGVELVSLLSYALAGFRKGHRRSAEAALKYVVYGGVASGVMLFGMSWLFGLSGTTQLAQFKTQLLSLGSAGELAVLTALVFILAGIGFKVAAVPWHMWAPDVYEGAPTPFTAFLSVAPKAAGFGLAVRLFDALAVIPWELVIGVIAAATMTVGNLAALNQQSVKRMLAWSSVAHAGYLLLGVCTRTAAGDSAVLFYLTTYLFMNLGAFLVVGAVARGGGGETLEDYRGLGARAPALALSFAVFLFSLTGLPPLAGFIGKFHLFKALIDRGGSLFVGLAVLAVLNSALSLYYYARVVRAMYLEGATTNARVALPATWPLLLAFFAGGTVVLGVAFEGLRSATDAAVLLRY